jgi:tetratricopeptide (TPR) repeat protein
MACARSFPSKAVSLSAWALACVLVALAPAWSQENVADWQQLVRAKAEAHQLDAAVALVDQQLVHVPGDLEAHGWRGRLLAWQGRWAGAELEYRFVLHRAPDDVDVLSGLADVLLWQGRPREALAAVDRARDLAPSQTSILLRRARILRGLENTSEARSQYREILRNEPGNQEATDGLAGLSAENKHELRMGADWSTFNYTNAAEAQGVILISHWTRRCSTTAETGFYQRFGQDATRFAGSSSFHFTKNDWLNAGGAVANANGIVPTNEAFFEYGHGLRVANRWIKGFEASYQQRWLWYQGAHVLTLSATQLYYLPGEWTWSLTLTGARSGFANAGIEWVPSGSTRLQFPLHRALTGNVAFANGTENFAQVDQIGHFSARTFAGGLKYRFEARQDISGYVAVQDRTQGRSQNSYGLSYGFRF